VLVSGSRRDRRAEGLDLCVKVHETGTINEHENWQ
jgi:hypothetical protein